jgi:hypothetical protein
MLQTKTDAACTSQQPKRRAHLGPDCWYGVGATTHRASGEWRPPMVAFHNSRHVVKLDNKHNRNGECTEDSMSLEIR